jgi:hypothetical protein
MRCLAALDRQVAGVAGPAGELGKGVAAALPGVRSSRRPSAPGMGRGQRPQRGVELGLGLGVQPALDLAAAAIRVGVHGQPVVLAGLMLLLEHPVLGVWVDHPAQVLAGDRQPAGIQAGGLLDQERFRFRLGLVRHPAGSLSRLFTHACACSAEIAPSASAAALRPG